MRKGLKYLSFSQERLSADAQCHVKSSCGGRGLGCPHSGEGGDEQVTAEHTVSSWCTKRPCSKMRWKGDQKRHVMLASSVHPPHTKIMSFKDIAFAITECNDAVKSAVCSSGGPMSICSTTWRLICSGHPVLSSGLCGHQIYMWYTSRQNIQTQKIKVRKSFVNCTE